MTRGEICLSRFPLAGRGGMKVRPVLLLTDPIGSVPELLTAYISSVIPPTLLPSDLLLDPTQTEFASTNLKRVSLLRIHKLATVHQGDVIPYLGVLGASAFQQVEARLRQLLNL